MKIWDTGTEAPGRAPVQAYDPLSARVFLRPLMSCRDNIYAAQEGISRSAEPTTLSFGPCQPAVLSSSRAKARPHVQLVFAARVRMVPCPWTRLLFSAERPPGCSLSLQDAVVASTRRMMAPSSVLRNMSSVSRPR